MGRGPHFPEAKQATLDLHAAHPTWNAASIQRRVEELAESDGFLVPGGEDPTATYRTWIRKADAGTSTPRVVEPNQPALTQFTADAVIEGRWSVGGVDSAPAPILLAALATVIKDTGGERTFLTTPEAGWIVRLSHLAPDAPAGDLYRIARAYLQRVRAGQPTDSLDQLLAFAPWRDGGVGYVEAYRAGWIPVMHRLVGGSDEPLAAPVRTARERRLTSPRSQSVRKPPRGRPV